MAHAVPGSGDIDAMARTVRQEFDEMPGLMLTAEQARRLWTIEPRMAAAVLNRLVETGYLCQTDSGLYVRPSAA